MAIKKVLLTKKIDNVVYDIFPKTSADVVVYGESTVAATLAQFAADIADRYTKGEADAAIKAESDALYNKIMGITVEDGASVAEAYDTLKEVAAWIDEHEGDIAAGFATDIAALKEAVGVAPAEGVEGSGLLKAMAEAQAAIEANDGDIADLQAAVEALETAVGDANSGLVKAMADAEARLDAAEGRLDAVEGRMDAAEGRLDTLEGALNDEGGVVARVETLEGALNDEGGLVDRVEALEAIEPTKVEASEVNGNIKVDGEEVVVYTHPATHAATEIVEDDDHQFVTVAQKEIINNAAAVVLVSSQDEVTNENNLYMVELA